MSELIDNRAHRIRTMKDIIKRLHEGSPLEDVQAQMTELVRQVDAGEIAAMEQELIADGLAVAEVQRMCDLHARAFRELVTQRREAQLPPGHPIDTFRRENEALSKAVAALRSAVEEVGAGADTAALPAALDRQRAAYNELMDIEQHYQRKEQLLFSCLERHGITGPSKVMWGKDDEVRELLKALGEALSVSDASAEEWKLVTETVTEPALRAVEEMIYKEENILLPMARDTLTEDEWGEIWQQSSEYGYCLVEPRDGYRPPESAAAPPEAQVPVDRAIVFPSGRLTMEQLQAVFATLPLDVTFVDADDRVRFFSEGSQRVFERSRAILGRKVQHCHPPKSMDVVEQIIADFRSGRQSVAEFWITLQGKFVHIRYFALRDPDGKYLGTLEMTQDLTQLRALAGERRLLEYDTAPGGQGP